MDTKEIATDEQKTKKKEFFRPYSKKTFKEVLNIALPALIESFFIALAGFVDTLMVSSLGSDSVASVGLTTQPKFIGLALFMALGVATSAVVARRFGEKDRKSANTTLVTSLSFAFIAAIIFSLLYIFGTDKIISLSGSSPDTHGDAVTYLRIIMGCMIFNCIQIIINSAQRGAGNTKITMTTNLTSNAINVIFNYLLIGGRLGFPALGIRGAAIATVLGTVVSCGMSVISVLRRDRFLSIPYIIKKKIRPAWQSFKNLCKFGYSIFLEQILVRTGLALTAIMAAKMGDDSLAAHQVGMNILSLSFALGDGLQSAAVALVGRSLGQKKPELAKEYGRTCQAFGAFVSFVLAVILFFGSDIIMGMFFKNDPHIVDIGRNIMRMIIVVVLFQTRQVVYMGCLRGAGDTLYTAFAATVCVTILRTVVSYTFAFLLDFAIVGVWAGIVADQVGRFLFSSIRFKRGKWVHIKI